MRAGRHRKSGDQISWLQARFYVGRAARFPVQIGEGHRPGAVPAQDLDGRVERDQSLRPIARISGNAGIRSAEHGVKPVDAIQCRASGARIALVALRIGGVAEIGAAGTLKHIAAERCHDAELLACRHP